ncbi:cyclic nucleotide-binding/CBS domain-containing protein [Rhodoferax sp. 4810]|uniref:Cyclic nucleotide-binding/CBS domain-containing protein n=1 Tax=Thiospirillum jenense TaxID=1653858 RepID=A0A839HJ46_9GAMM|nr:putative nucleotidyltransferase substrate binding domain-containing protein [Thiospirillum jenense]MBB1075794.1 cyclic nucleotide-binding/CBS domain-containing protein [Rhodoferax jenense]MBB1126868.1 cyclic nucleotide-binding/CBS domain-containing protein [Thiospirillum jenense]
MDIELVEIRDFLSQHPPFNSLPSAMLDQLPKRLIVRYLRRGSAFPPNDEPAPQCYIVRRGAIELRDAQGELSNKLAEGDCTLALCQSDAVNQSALTGITSEDTLLYLLPCHELERLRTLSPTFAAHFDQSVSERLRQALAQIKTSHSNTDLMTVKVRDLMSPRLIDTHPDTTIADAARLMRDGRCSSLVIKDKANEQLAGLITVRDLRDRCLAADLSPQRPVRDMMTINLHTTTADTPAFEALLTMSRLNVHHLPVLHDNQVIGVISTSDLVRFQSTNAVYLVSDIHKAEQLDTLVAISRQLPALQIHLMSAGATGDQVGQAMTAVSDAISQRLIQLAELTLGTPPVPYCWLVGGSQARREQTIHSDQDNALLIDDGATPECAEYFTAFAQFITTGLNACGYVFCPGDVMASNPEWRQPRLVWRRYFTDWIERPQPQALLNASVFFDLRSLHDPAQLFLSLQREILHSTQTNRLFIAYLAANAIKHRPPLGFFRNFVLIHGGEHDHTFDLKLSGIVPIIDMARVYALSAGIPEVNTLERLRAVAGSQALSHNGAANLIDAMELISTLRVRHQTECLRNGQPVNNFLSPDALSPLERGHLKDAFALIATLQEALGQRYQAGKFG